ncbi:MAG: alpha/beta hydrolase [Planctomycetota bacterium]
MFLPLRSARHTPAEPSLLVGLFVTLAAVFPAVHPAAAQDNHGVHLPDPIASEPDPAAVRYGVQPVDGLDIFYREAGTPPGKSTPGNPDRPAVVLLHGFPSSSHQYRDVLAALGDEFYLIAPDYPGFGDSSFPPPEEYDYRFDQLAQTIDRFLEAKQIDRYVLVIHDYGAPVGFRIALAHPERLAGLVVQNGNAYEQGIGPDGWGPVLDYWKNKTPELEKTIAQNVFGLEGLRWQYTHGTRHPDRILPDNWNLDYLKLSRPGQHRVQLDLFYDYQNNLKQYPAWQAFLREHQPPTLVTWGVHDAFFPVPGAEGYARDLDDVEIHLLDTGHFPLEEDGPFIIRKMRDFLHRLGD